MKRIFFSILKSKTRFPKKCTAQKNRLGALYMEVIDIITSLSKSNSSQGRGDFLYKKHLDKQLEINRDTKETLIKTNI